MSNTIDVSKLSSKELEQLLEQKKKEEKQTYAERKVQYEAYRDKMVEELVKEAKELNQKIAEFKKKVMHRMESFKEKAETYGDVRSHSKGGYSLRTSTQKFKVVYEHNSAPEYDERAEMAEALIKEFLEDLVKVKDARTYRTISALMSRNRKGDFSTARIASLLKIKDNYDDKRWERAMQLFEESFQNRSISNSVSFYEKNEDNKDCHIPLSFTSA